MAQVSYGQMTIADLTDNYQVQLSPESASFAGGTSSAKDGNITVIVSTLQGNKRIAHTIGTPTGLPSGMTVTNKVNGTATADGSFKVNVTTTLTSTSGYFTIPITVGGVVYSRRFSYSVGREGASVTITDKSVTYQVGSSGTSAPTGTWQNTVQTPAENQYLWTKTEVTYSDGNKTVAYSVSRNAKNGNNGTSPTVSSTKTEYQQSTNGTTPPTGTWLTSAPDAIAGQYMWTRTTVTYSDSATAVSYSVSRNGADGERGTGFYSVTTAPSAYTTKVSSFTPSYRIALSTVKSQAGVSEVLVGDVIQQGYNTYPVGYVDSNYVYLGAANSIRGQAGAAGLHSAQVVLYQRGTTAPNKPSGDVTYTFATGKATNNLGSWSQTIPSGTNPVYMIAASASSTAATDTIPSSEWSAPVKILEDGTDGYNQATIFLYQRAASAPSKPTATPTYTFSTGALSANPSGWSRTIPTNNGNPCYVTTAVAISKTGTATVSGWSDVAKLVEDGVSVSNVTSSKNGDTTTITITYSDGRTPSTFTVKDGANGAPGDTGATAQWYYGDKLSHTSGAVTKTTSETATPDAVVGSMYLNPDTSLCYRCTKIEGSNVTWTYAGDLTTGVINNIEIGGRNLIRNGDFSNSTAYWTKEGSTSYSVVTDARFGHALSIVFSAAGSASNRVYQNIADKPITHINGESRAIRFWAKASTATTITVGRAGTAQLYLSAKPVSTAWQKYEANIVANGTGSLTFFAGTACTLYLTNIMLVSGNVPMDWSPAPEDTETAIANLTELTDSLQTQIDSKIETWTQVADPATGWNTTALKDSHVGDLWYYIGETTTNPSRENNSTYKYTLSNGTYSWVKYVSGTDMTGVFDKIDGKSTIFYGTTTGTYTGVQKDDYLVDSTTGNTYKYDPTVTTNNHWVEVTNYKTGIDEAKQDVVDLDTSFTQEKVFNRLTNNGQAQGLMFDDTTGDLYINASYIHSGTLTLGGNGNVNGTLKILDSNSQTVGYWSNTGLNAISGKIGGWEIDQYELSNSTQSNASGETVYYDAVMRASTYPSGTINDTNLAFGVQKTTVSSSGSATSDETLFGVYYNGTLYSSNADIQGKITATSGSIGGFNIINTNDSTKTTANGGHSYANSLYKITNDGTYEYEVGMKASSGSTDLAFYVKRIPLGEAWNSSNLTNLFYVANNGALYASNATIDGKFTCTNTEIRSTLTIENGVITGRWDNQETFIDLNNCQYIGGTSRGTIGLFSNDQIALYARDTIFSWGKSVLIMAGDYSNIGYCYTTGVNDYSVKICTGATGSIYYEFQADGVFKTVGLVVKTGIEIAYSTPYIDFHFNNSTADYTSRLIETSSGVLDLKKSGGTYGTLRAVISNQSSIHVKRNITDISSDDANKLLSLRPVEFDYKWGQHDYGMIAEEVYEYLPNLVTIPDGFDADTYEYKNMDDQVPSLRYQQFIPYIIKLLQNQQAEINELKGRNLQ
jgi:hypothetical protein